MTWCYNRNTKLTQLLIAENIGVKGNLTKLYINILNTGDIISGGQGGFKPIQRSTFEIGQGIGNLGTVISKHVGTVLEVKEALSQEGL